jgi:hypothetical protein
MLNCLRTFVAHLRRSTAPKDSDITVTPLEFFMHDGRLFDERIYMPHIGSQHTDWPYRCVPLYISDTYRSTTRVLARPCGAARLHSCSCGRDKKKVRAQFYNLLTHIHMRQGSKVTILLVECLQTAELHVGSAMCMCWFTMATPPSRLFSLATTFVRSS